MTQQVKHAVRFVLVAAMCAGCMDLTPIVLEQASPPDASVGASDGSLSASDGPPSDAPADAPSSCDLCMSRVTDGGAPGCGAPLDACLADPKCAIFYQCAIIDNGCLKLEYQASLACGFPCAVKAGIHVLSDPSVTLFVAAANCGVTVCATTCGFVQSDAASQSTH